MDDTVSPRSTFLFARPRALHGVARLFDFLGTYDSYNMSSSPQEADLLAVFQDWLAVEDDARKVLDSRSPPRPE